MKAPASMKNGTAMNENESTEVNIRCATTISGIFMNAYRTMADDAPSAIPIGTPMRRIVRNPRKTVQRIMRPPPSSAGAR